MFQQDLPDEARVTSCVYRDICFDPKVGTFLYYKNPKEDIKERTTSDIFRGETKGQGFLYPGMTIALSVANRGHSPPFLHGLAWTPERVDETIPEDAVWDASGISILYQAYHGHNFGHMLFDEV